MRAMIAKLGFAATLAGCAVTTVLAPAQAASVTDATTYGPKGVTESQTIHYRHGSRTVRTFYGRNGRVCHAIVGVHHTPGGTVKSERRICN